MRAVEVTGTVDEKGQLSLDSPMSVEMPSRVRVIVLFTEPTDELENDNLFLSPSPSPEVINSFPLAPPLLRGAGGGSSGSEPSPSFDPDDTPIESIKASLRRALQQAKAGQRIPLEQMWEGIDAE